MRDSTKGTLIGVLGTLVLVVSAALAWRFGSRHGMVLTDGARIRVPEAAAPVREVLWEPADLLPPWINQGDENYEPRVSNDGRVLLFVRGRAGGAADLFAVEHTRDGWGEAFAIEGVSTPGADELGPVLSADGRVLYFYSDREGGLGGYDLWRVRRADDPAGSLREAVWDTPENLGPAVNSRFNDYGPAPTPEGTVLFFASNRPREQEAAEDPSRSWPATVREEFDRRDYDLYASVITDRGPGEATRVEGISTPSNEGTPAVSPAGDFLYFASDRPGGAGGLDIYRARIRGGAVLDAENLAWPINTGANELDPALSMNGFALHFSSNREHRPETGDGPGAPAAGGPLAEGVAAQVSTPPESAATTSDQESAPRYAIYSTISREVFRERNPVLAGFDWAAAWGAVWPWLLLLALLALLLYLLRRFLRDEQMKARWRTLSLLAKCLILSLLLHAMLAALFTVWYVAGSVGDMLRRPGGTRVALVSRAIGSDLASQVRGGLTDLTVQPQAPSTTRAAPDVGSEARVIEARFDTDRALASDAPLASNPDDAAADSNPHLSSREFAPPTIQPLANAPDALATPTSSAMTAMSESELTTRVQSADLPTAAATLPTSPTASAAIEVARVNVRDTPLESQDLDAAPEAPPSDDRPTAAAARTFTMEPPSAAPTRVATPESAARSTAEENTVRVEPSAPSMSARSASVPTAAIGPSGTATFTPASISSPSDQPLTANRADSPEASAATSHTLVGVVAAIEIAHPQNHSPPAVPLADRSLATPESAMTIRAQGAPATRSSSTLPSHDAVEELTLPFLAPATPAVGSTESDLAASLAAPESIVGRSDPRASASSLVPTIPTSSAPPLAATPDSPSSAAAPERTLQIAAAQPNRFDLEASRPQVPDGASTTPAEFEVLRSATSSDGTLAPVPNADASNSRAASPNTLPHSITVDVAASSAQLSLAIPAAATTRTTTETESGDQPSTAPTRSLSPPDLAASFDGQAPSTRLELEPAEPESTGDRSRVTDAAISAREASSRPISAAPTASIPINVHSVPTPFVALPEATEEPPEPAQVEPIGTLAGTVRDVETGEPISGARIRLDLTDAPPIVARSNSRGQYRLSVPAGIPENVAISATAPGYTPASINVGLEEIARAEGRGQPLARDFELTPLAWNVVPIEEDPEVHHLGNDEFEGAINSQFQRDSEGLTYLAEFTLGSDQVYPGIRAAELAILAKGAQANNPIRINGRELDSFIVETPRDGSFGELTFRVPPRWLREGVNTIEIFSVRGSNDLDDFEFVNPRLRLRPSAAREEAP